MAKSVLILLGLTTAAPKIDAAIQKKIHNSEYNGSGATTLVIANEEKKGNMRILKFL